MADVSCCNLKFTSASFDGKELGYLKDGTVDMEIGEKNDFEIQIDSNHWNSEIYNYGNRIYIPETEYGGIMNECEVHTENSKMYWRGYTWRGILNNKLIYPPSGLTHLVVSGDANSIIKEIIGERFGTLFVVSSEMSHIEIKSFKFDRYCTILSGLQKMLESVNARLSVKYVQGKSGENGGHVVLQAEKITDWTGTLEYSQDGNLNFTTKDYRRGVNHLVCAGEGEGISRTILHLYVQQDGTIGETQYFKGIHEHEALYSYTSVESDEKLKEDGISRLKEMMNYKQMDMSVDDMELEIGDIVGGRDRITGMTLKKPVTGKILKIESEECSIEYRLKGEE